MAKNYSPFNRTDTQNDALHLYFEQIAEALNDAGYDIQKTLAQYKVDIPWTKESVKELIWRLCQKSMFSKRSTTELDRTREINQIVEVITRFLGKLGVEYIPFPHNPPK